MKSKFLKRVEKFTKNTQRTQEMSVRIVGAITSGNRARLEEVIGDLTGSERAIFKRHLRTQQDASGIEDAETRNKAEFIARGDALGAMIVDITNAQLKTGKVIMPEPVASTKTDTPRGDLWSVVTQDVIERGLRPGGLN